VSRLEVPLIAKRLRTTGDILLRAEVGIMVKTSTQTWEQVIFRVDSATEMRTFDKERVDAVA
jgi:hypothetical protein